MRLLVFPMLICTILLGTPALMAKTAPPPLSLMADGSLRSCTPDACRTYFPAKPVYSLLAADAYLTGAPDRSTDSFFPLRSDFRSLVAMAVPSSTFSDLIRMVKHELRSGAIGISLNYDKVNNTVCITSEYTAEPGRQLCAAAAPVYHA